MLVRLHLTGIVAENASGEPCYHGLLAAVDNHGF